MKYVICYDISSDKRRDKMSALLEIYGIRVQKSVFECDLEVKSIGKLIQIIKKIILKDDSVRIYYLCKECYCKSLGIGKEPDNVLKDGFVIF